jgi:hypothetical protein
MKTATHQHPVGAKDIFAALAIAVSAIISVLATAFSTVLWAETISRWTFSAEGTPVWLVGLGTTALGIGAFWCAWRLWRHMIATHRVASVPAWFIPALAGMFLVAVAFAAVDLMSIDKRSALFFIQCVGVCTALFLFGRHSSRVPREYDRAA